MPGGSAFYKLFRPEPGMKTPKSEGLRPAQKLQNRRF